MAGSIYDNVGSLFAGGTPQLEFDPSQFTLTPQPEFQPAVAGPTQVAPTLAQRLGGFMNKPGVAQALAMGGQLGTNMGGRGLLANDVSALATKLAAGKGVGVGTQPTLPGLVPNQPVQQQPAQGQFHPADTDKSGDVSPKEMEVYKEKITIETTGGQPLENGMTRVGSLLAQNPTMGAGSQAGMPVAAPQAPARDLSRNDNLMMLSGLTNPDFALEVAKQEPLQMNARAQMMEAQYKNAMLAPTYAKMSAEANKINWEMSPDYIKFQGDLEAAKKSGDLAAQRENTEALAKIADQQTFNHPLFGKITGGQIIRMTGVTNPAAISSLMSTATSLETAKIGAGATVSAAKIRAAGEVSAADIAATKTILANQIAMINQARGVVAMYEKQRMVAPETQWADLDKKKNEWEAILSEYKTQHANTIKLLGQNVPSEITPGTPPPAKLAVPFEATSELKADKKINGKVYPKGTKLMIVNGGAYDSNGNLITTVK